MKSTSKLARLPESEIVVQVIRNFVVKHRRDRYCALTEKPNKYGGYGFGELAHFLDNLDLRFCKKIPAGLQSVDYVLHEIKSLTQTAECYIMHESSDFDGKWMDLKDALRAILGQNLGAFILVDNGAIIYHESETAKERYLGVRY
jgi:hypothetical protein